MPGTSLVGALPELLVRLDNLRTVASQEGIEFDVADFGGLRSQADTALIMQYRDNDWNAAVRADPTLAKRTTKEKWRAIAPWGNSMHNYGAAFDVKIRKAPKGKSNLWALNRLIELGKQVGLDNGQSYDDPGHFQLRMTLAQAAAEWKKQNPTSSIFGQVKEVASNIVSDAKKGTASPAVISVLAIVFFATLFYFLVIR